MPMPTVALVLAFCGRNGTVVLFLGAFAGLGIPFLAEAARPLMPLAVFVFTLGAFLKVDLAAFREEIRRPGETVIMLAWVMAGVPLAAVALVALLKPPPGIAQGLILIMLAPPVGSAAALAAMLGLRASLALVLTVAATVASPLAMPPLADWLTGARLAIEPVAMTLRLLAIVGGALAAAWALRRCAGRFVEENPSAMTGIAVIGLVTVAVGAMHGLRPVVEAAPLTCLAVLVAALAANGGLQALGALLFAPLGHERALTVGLVSGNRNVTLVWAAAGTSLAAHPEVELFLAASVVAIFTLPLVSALPVRWVLRNRPRLVVRVETGGPRRAP